MPKDAFISDPNSVCVQGGATLCPEGANAPLKFRNIYILYMIHIIDLKVTLNKNKKFRISNTSCPFGKKWLFQVHLAAIAGLKQKKLPYPIKW